MIRFAYPWFFLGILLLIPLYIFSRRSGGRLKFSSLQIFKEMGVSAINPRIILISLRILALILFLCALARPQSGRKFTQVQSEGIDIFMVLDTSGSMEALDFSESVKKITRLDVVKEVVEDFILKRAGDRLGLIVFGDEAFTQCPLTLDHGVLVEFLKKVEIGMAGRATAIGSSIGIGVNRMKDLKAKSKVVILLTDGQNTAGQLDPLKAAKIAKTYGVKVYTIGVGTDGRAPFLRETWLGKRIVYEHVPMDEPTLKNIASITGAQYYRADNKQRLLDIYDEIDKLEKTEIEVKEYTEFNELFHYFLIPGLLLLLLEILLGHTILRKLP